MSIEIPKQYDPGPVEKRWLDFWLQSEFFAPEPSSPSEPYSIVIPPPNITGRLHAGHALNITLQDILVRWNRMRGRDVLWLPGTDHAGIATQMVVERALQKEGTNRHEVGRAGFEKRVWEWKRENGGAIVEQLKRLGASCDWSRLRFTLDESLSKAVREVFVQLYEEGLIYRGQAIVNWCPGCRTAISDLEVAHKELSGKLYYLNYPLKNSTDFISVATTRPETMLGDTAVAVHPEDKRYSHLIGKRVLLPVLNRDIPIVADGAVKFEFGTGAVKVTPAHDPNDFAIAKRHGLPSVVVINEAARMTEAAGPYAGQDRFECRKKLIEDLSKSKVLEKTEEHQHAVGHCDRCDQVVEPYLSSQWFVKTATLAQVALQAVENGNPRFVPENRKNDYYEWMRNIHDWCISRQLWWGHRIPAWTCSECGERVVAREDPVSCPNGHATSLVQDPDVLDTWFSSALWPFSTLGWPEKTADLERYYPTSVLVTGYDILFFWVARMMMMGLKFMGQVPFNQVYFNGLIRDAHGKKMSKTRGNTVDPIDLMDRFGTDSLRFTLASMSTPGSDIALDLKRVEGYQAFTNKIWNATRFVLLNLEPDASPVSSLPERQQLSRCDRWILSRVTRLAREVNRALSEFRFDEAAGALYQFFWHEFCDWYIEFSKPHLVGEASQSIAAKQTRTVLVAVLDRALRLLHPLTPFLTEELWQRIPHRGESLTKAEFPLGDDSGHDSEAERDVEFLMAFITKIRNLRAERRIEPARKVRVYCKVSEPELERLLTEEASHIHNLARVTQVVLVAEVPEKELSARGVIKGAEIAIPLADALDLEGEKLRLGRQIEKLERELDTTRRKLENASFLEKAAPPVVEKVRTTHAELESKKEKLLESLEALRPRENPPNEG